VAPQGRTVAPSSVAVRPTDSMQTSPPAFAATAGSTPSGSMPTGSMQPGTVKIWYEDKGFGFLVPQGGGPDVFVHRSKLIDGQMLAAGAQVMFETQWNAAKNKYQCERCSGAISGDQAGAAAASVAAPPALRQPVIEPSNNMFVAGLPMQITEEAVREIFSAYGLVQSLKVLPDSGRGDRAALVRMADPNQAQWIVDNLNNNIPVGLAGISNTPLTVRYADNRADKAKILGLPKGAGKGVAEMNSALSQNRYSPYGSGVAGAAAAAAAIASNLMGASASAPSSSTAGAAASASTSGAPAAAAATPVAATPAAATPAPAPPAAAAPELSSAALVAASTQLMAPAPAASPAPPAASPAPPAPSPTPPVASPAPAAASQSSPAPAPTGSPNPQLDQLQTLLASGAIDPTMFMNVLNAAQGTPAGAPQGVSPASAPSAAQPMANGAFNGMGMNAPAGLPPAGTPPAPETFAATGMADISSFAPPQVDMSLFAGLGITP